MPSPLQKYCWLSYKIGTWWGLFVPVACSIFFSIICVVAVGVLRKRVVPCESEDDKRKKFWSNYIAFAVVLVFYTINWLMAFLELDPFHTKIPYVFYVVHALLGVIVSLLYSAFNYEIRNVLRAKISPD
ncbi:uncharacterized protein [Antedon mediterranea]|uniref:uncharacterized protein n=1 Tax=Antedon mediterranea TaxID=105859 RepID=UPI003AF48F0E